MIPTKEEEVFFEDWDKSALTAISEIVKDKKVLDLYGFYFFGEDSDRRENLRHFRYPVEKILAPTTPRKIIIESIDHHEHCMGMSTYVFLFSDKEIKVAEGLICSSNTTFDIKDRPSFETFKSSLKAFIENNPPDPAEAILVSEKIDVMITLIEDDVIDCSLLVLDKDACTALRTIGKDAE